MTEPTAQEVLMWAMVNRARLDPNGEAARFGISLNEGPVTDFGNPPKVVTLTGDSKQPLAFNTSLYTAADAHAQDMINRNLQFHDDPQNPANTVQQRAINAGYNPSPTRFVGENIANIQNQGALDPTQAMQDMYKNLFIDLGTVGRGHRYNILLDDYQEIGIGQAFGKIGANNASEVSMDFGKSATVAQFLTGIAYNDTDHNAFYSIGEGQGSIKVALSSGSVITQSAGNFSQAINAGVQTVTFSGGDLANPVSVNINVAAGRNALVDTVDQSTVETSVSLTALSGVTKIIGLGNTGLTLTGNGADNIIVDALGNDTLDGGAGNDTAVLSGNKASYTVVKNADGTVTVTGNGHTDKLISIEKIQFADGFTDLSPAPVAGSVSVASTSIAEGNSGAQLMTFTLTRSGGAAAFDVNFTTSDGTATVANGDYTAVNIPVHFGVNETSKTITVAVKGDTVVEANETFNVTLSGATNGATISGANATGTILNDDVAPVAGSIAINDVQIAEGDSGTKTMTFTVTRSGGTAAFDVDFATKAGTASAADGDYVARGSTLHFNAGETAKTIDVVVNGDTKVEANETFSMVLSNATNGATIADGTGIGTILNDDIVAPVAGSIAINDVTITEGDSGTKTMTFTVTRADGTAAFDVDFATKAGTASAADGDYVARGNTLHFNAGETTKTIDVVVNGDTKIEETETFSMVLSNVTNGAKIADGTGIGTILDNDKASAEDFNGDGNSDILFHNTNGSVAMWQMNGMNTLANVGAGTQATSWHAIDAFDFNGDGKADVLWQNDSGQVQLWQMNGASVAQTTNLGSVPAGFHVSGVNDFTGDGKAEVLLSNDAGQVQMWNMNGASHTTSNVGTVAAGWSIKDTADFTGDGKADILLQNGNAVAMWQMDGATVKSSTTFATVGDAFHFAGAADFNGDGKADILWHNDTTGQVVLWEMNGTNILSNTTVGTTAKGWEIADLGDYNHDGKADILLQNTSGSIAEWQMNGDHILATQTIGSVSTDWHML